MTTPHMLAGARSAGQTKSGPTYHGTVTYIPAEHRATDDMPDPIIICSHRHRLARAARECAFRLKNEAWQRLAAQRAVTYTVDALDGFGEDDDADPA